ncbi:MAG: acyl-CoA mutase large subunit family protein [Candidatus Dormibacteria bacterium]
MSLARDRDAPAGADGAARTTDSGIELKPVYTPADAPPSLPDPGEYPYGRGIHRDMYRGRAWTMRQYAGFGTARETNQRFKFLLAAGQTGLSCAFDLPTQMGYDSDAPEADGEVGKVGVAISSLRDMEVLLEGIDLARVTTSMTINATASMLLLLYTLVAEQQGADLAKLSGTVQNDILKEYAARGTYIFPPKPSMRIITDLFAWCQDRLPTWNTISISGYHIREAGSTAAEELGFTLSNGIAYVQAALDAGLRVDDFAPRLAFFFNAHMNFFEEVAKFRAARILWAGIMRERFGATNPRSWALRFHTQTAGSALTSQQPYNNVVRVALQALSAVLGGTQSLHTNGFDEALGVPTEEAARLALRTQQVLAGETGVTDVADPLGGSYLVESLTRSLVDAAGGIIDEVDRLGGSVAAIEAGFMQRRIQESAYRYQLAVEDEQRIVVGVNRYRDQGDAAIPIQKVGPHHQDDQVRALAELRRNRDNGAVEAALVRLRSEAAGTGNLLIPLREVLAAYGTIGESCRVLREVFGHYVPVGGV